MRPSNPLMQSQWNFVSIELIQIAGSGYSCFCISCDVSSVVQSQSVFCLIRIAELIVMYSSLRSTTGATHANLLPAIITANKLKLMGGGS